MVSLSFNIPEHKPMLFDGRKDQTIRLYNEKRYSQIARAENIEIYWKLRMSHAKGGSEKLFDARMVEIFPIYLFSNNPPRQMIEGAWPNRQGNMSIGAWPRLCSGRNFTIPMFDELVRRDGFETGVQLYNALYRMHDDKVFDHKFFVTRFARKVA